MILSGHDLGRKEGRVEFFSESSRGEVQVRLEWLQRKLKNDGSTVLG